MPLTPQQERFCAEYLVDLNAAAAYQREYPGAKRGTARANGFKLLALVSVQSRIAELQAERAKRTDVTADMVVAELARIAFARGRSAYRPDGTLKAPHEWDDDTDASIAGVETVEERAGGAEEQREGQPHGGALKRSRAAAAAVRKVKRWDKTKALELLGRHLGMFVDRVRLEGGSPVILDLSDVPLERLRAAERLLGLAPGDGGPVGVGVDDPEGRPAGVGAAGAPPLPLPAGG